ncbi:hypothetical protein NVIRENTERO_00559 [Sodalis praecaptivus]|nr:hypothetical protein NVIRENTERO_00559 [Sodalis praecaptivus]
MGVSCRRHQGHTICRDFQNLISRNPRRISARSFTTFIILAAALLSIFYLSRKPIGRKLSSPPRSHYSPRFSKSYIPQSKPYIRKILHHLHRTCRSTPVYLFFTDGAARTRITIGVLVACRIYPCRIIAYLQIHFDTPSRSNRITSYRSTSSVIPLPRHPVYILYPTCRARYSAFIAMPW